MGSSSVLGPNLGHLANAQVRQKNGITERPKNTDRRIAEYILGIGGCYSTPSDKDVASGRMQTGFEVYRRLADQMKLRIDTGDGGFIYEIHPTYGFRSFLGIEPNGARLRCDPTRLATWRRWIGLSVTGSDNRQGARPVGRRRSCRHPPGDSTNRRRRGPEESSRGADGTGRLWRPTNPVVRSGVHRGEGSRATDIWRPNVRQRPESLVRHRQGKLLATFG
jgi:hypothetical protein